MSVFANRSDVSTNITKIDVPAVLIKIEVTNGQLIHLMVKSIFLW